MKIKDRAYKIQAAMHNSTDWCYISAGEVVVLLEEELIMNCPFSKILTRYGICWVNKDELQRC